MKKFSKTSGESSKIIKATAKPSDSQSTERLKGLGENVLSERSMDKLIKKLDKEDRQVVAQKVALRHGRRVDQLSPKEKAQYDKLDQRENEITAELEALYKERFGQ